MYYIVMFILIILNNKIKYRHLLSDHLVCALKRFDSIESLYRPIDRPFDCQTLTTYVSILIEKKTKFSTAKCSIDFAEMMVINCKC